MGHHSTAKHQDTSAELNRAEARLRHWQEVYRFWVREHKETDDSESYAYANAAWVAISKLEKVVTALKNRGYMNDAALHKTMMEARPRR